jgi:hypothetical protein
MKLLFKRVLVIGTLIIFAILCFLVFDTEFHGCDEPIYFAYTESIIENHDLNVVDQVYEKGASFDVSKTYNMPDLRSHGGILAWWPFYLYGRYAYRFQHLSVLPQVPPKACSKWAMSFSTVLFGILALILSVILCKRYFPLSIVLWSTIVLFAGTPFFYYMLFEVGNANILAACFSATLILLCCSIDVKKRVHLFLLGLFFSITLILKVDLWFYFTFILAFIVLQTGFRWQTAFIGLGMLPGFILKGINDFIRYGYIHNAELGVVNMKSFYFVEQMFSQYHGYFSSSPIFILCIVFGIIVTVKVCRNLFRSRVLKTEDVVMIASLIYFIVKLGITSFRFAWGGGSAGARQLIVDVPLCIFMYSCFLKNKKVPVVVPIILASICFVVWNLITVSEYASKVDILYIAGNPELIMRFWNMVKILTYLFVIKQFILKAVLLGPLLGACITVFIGVFLFIMVNNKNSSRRLLSRRRSDSAVVSVCAWLTVYCYLAYTIITGSNIANNKINVLSLKRDGFFARARIVPPQKYEAAENLESTDEMIAYYTVTHDVDKIHKLIKIRKDLCQYE